MKRLAGFALALLGLAPAALVSAHDDIGIFETIVTTDDPTLKKDAMFNLAWLYSETGKTEKSTATYERLLSEFPDSRYGDLVREKIRG